MDPRHGWRHALHAHDLRVVEARGETITPSRARRDAEPACARSVGADTDGGVEEIGLEAVDVEPAELPGDRGLPRAEDARQPLCSRGGVLRNVEALISADLGREEA